MPPEYDVRLTETFPITRDELVRATEKTIQNVVESEDGTLRGECLGVAHTATHVIADYLEETKAFGPCGCLIGTLYINRGFTDFHDLYPQLTTCEHALANWFPDCLAEILGKTFDRDELFTTVFEVLPDEQVAEWRRYNT